jgi:hypothetical protein
MPDPVELDPLLFGTHSLRRTKATLIFVAKTATSGWLSLAEFGKLLRYYAGWGMRIAFVPEERVTENPKIVVRDPKKGRRR